MGNGRGRDQSHEPGEPGAIVRPLHPPEPEANGVLEDDWYETERLTGQITGRALAGRDTPGKEGAVRLDWRREDSAPPPSALERLERRLKDRERRRQRGDQPAMARPYAQDTLTSQARRGRRTPVRARVLLRAESGGRGFLNRGQAEGGFTLARRASRALGVIAAAGLIAMSSLALPSVLGKRTRPRSGGSAALAWSIPSAAFSDLNATAIGAATNWPRHIRQPRVFAAHHAGRSARTIALKHTRASAPAPGEQSSAPGTRVDVSSASSINTVSSAAGSGLSSSFSAQSPPVDQVSSSAKTSASASQDQAQTAGPSGFGGVVGSNCNPKCS